MSRCFPYPRVGYCRNGAAYEALIESIKLQKETDKTRTERKKEKRAKKEKKEKKRKEQRNSEDEIKLQKKLSGDYCLKGLQKAADFTEAQTNETNFTTELLERSVLTDEFGPSIGSQQPSYSSDSTQNSNKRKRDDEGSLPGSSTVHGNSFKIRLLKKHKVSDSSNFGADANMNTHLSGPSSNLNGSHVSSIRHNAVLATSGIENTSHLKSGLISEGSKIGDLNRVRFGKIQSPPRQVHPQSQLLSITQSTSLTRHIDEPKHCYPQINMVSNKVNTANGVGVPMTVSLSHKKLKEDAQKEAPTRSEKKMMKKHTKYEKLIGSWLPPVFQAHLPDGGDDEDWLCRSKASSSLVSKGEVETCRQSMASWQPCARFLVEVDMHALPYTVPF